MLDDTIIVSLQEKGAKWMLQWKQGCYVYKLAPELLQLVSYKIIWETLQMYR